MPKWLGAVLGAVFATITTFAVVVIIHLTHSPATPYAAREIGPRPAPVVTPMPVAATATARPHKRQVATKRQRAAVILARHDTPASRKARQEIDQLLSGR
jgi:hypothetical protein